MRTLVTGSNFSGSWSIRGEQLGAAIGAEVRNKVVDLTGYDRAILIKRALCENRADAYIIWDIVDAWPQPVGNHWGREECIDWAKDQARRVGAKAIVAATQAMANDLSDLGLPMLALPHHHRPDIAINPIRRKVRKVGYEGALHYLGRWESALRNQCAARGWDFIVNPEHLADLDIVVALRDFDGWAAKHWKSNVKLANAQGSGTPVIVTPEAGYSETQSGAEFWVSSDDGLGTAFDLLGDYDRRVKISAALRSVAPDLTTIARRYSSWLQQLKY
jgi:hypothetical protein